MGQRGEENLEIIPVARFPLKSSNGEVQSEIFLDLENPDLCLWVCHCQQIITKCKVHANHNSPTMRNC